jgi:hypothetical protein
MNRYDEHCVNTIPANLPWTAPFVQFTGTTPANEANAEVSQSSRFQGLSRPPRPGCSWPAAHSSSSSSSSSSSYMLRCTTPRRAQPASPENTALCATAEFSMENPGGGMCPTAVYGGPRTTPSTSLASLHRQPRLSALSRSAGDPRHQDTTTPENQVARGNMLESAGRADGSSPRPIQRFAWVCLLTRFGCESQADALLGALPAGCSR